MSALQRVMRMYQFQITCYATISVNNLENFISRDLLGRPLMVREELTKNALLSGCSGNVAHRVKIGFNSIKSNAKCNLLNALLIRCIYLDP